MRRERRTLASIDTRRRGALFHRSLYIVPLALAVLAITAASALAHTVAATATCGSVTFNWGDFSSSGSGNGGLNAPAWVIVFTPTSGSSTTLRGTTSFPGSTSSLTVAIPRGNGVVTASSAWTPAETRDGNSNSGSTTDTIANCPAAIVAPPPPLVAPAVAALHPVGSVNVPAAVALTTTASPPTTLGATIYDTALLSGGSSPTGTITFALYSASDPTCSTVLDEVSDAVNGDGSYVSPAVTPTFPGSYQWVASYGGDANNHSVSAPCNDPTELSTVAAAVCASPAALLGLPETVKNSLSAYVPAAGVKSVTFYLDGHKRQTLTKPSHQRFSIDINTRTLSYGVHRLSAKVTMLSSSCASEATGSFIRVKPNSLRPTFAG
jgi:hypothetical protein